MFAHRGHIEALTQPRSLQPGSSPVLGSVARDGHDRCIDSRLGSSVRGNASFGTVAGISEPVAHKPPGAGSSLLSSKGFSATAGTAACTDSHRQHVCGFVYKSPERNSLKGAVQAGNGLSSSSSELRTHPQSPDLRGGHVFEEGDSSGRAEVDLFAKSENTHYPLFFTPRWHHAGQQLGCMHFLRSRNVATGVMRDQGGASISDTHRPEPAWVPRLHGTAGGTALADPGRKHMLSQVDGSVWHSNQELWSHHVWSLQGYQRRWAPFSLACSHAHGSANTLYKMFVCFIMGSVCERVRLISTRLLAPYRMFGVSRCTDWIVDRYHRHWSLCGGHCRVSFPAERAIVR